MNQTSNASLFQKALEAAEALSLDDRAILIDTLNNRLNRQKSQQLGEEIQEIREEYRSGKVKFGSVNNFLAELDN